MELVQDKNSRAGVIGVLLFLVLVALFLFLLKLTYQDPPPINEGAMLIDFGNEGGGSSSSQESEAESESETESSTNNLDATENVTASATENVQTQTTTETVAINAASNNSATETQETEQVVSDNLSNVMNALENANNSSQSNAQNDGTDNGNSTGNGTGDGSGNGPSKGPGWELGGRGAVHLVTPKNAPQEEGTVVVTIIVDNKGKVIKATPGARGSNTTNGTLYKLAKEAALKATFTVKANALDQKGTMTFVFILN